MLIDSNTLNQKINMFGEIERDFEHMAQFVPQGGLRYRLFMWFAKQARIEREKYRAERDELRKNQENIIDE